jgi:hypothetical protein
VIQFIAQCFISNLSPRQLIALGDLLNKAGSAALARQQSLADALQGVRASLSKLAE